MLELEDELGNGFLEGPELRRKVFNPFELGQHTNFKNQTFALSAT